MKLRIAAAFSLVIASLLPGACQRFSRSARDDLKPRSSPVQVGEMAPNFTLEDQNGQKVALSEAHSKAPVVLVFYRASW
jgi:cytochrome oxidase Cu insertion factor (SCO1/SenC/PrrC family)